MDARRGTLENLNTLVKDARIPEDDILNGKATAITKLMALQERFNKEAGIPDIVPIMEEIVEGGGELNWADLPENNITEPIVITQDLPTDGRNSIDVTVQLPSFGQSSERRIAVIAELKATFHHNVPTYLMVETFVPGISEEFPNYPFNENSTVSFNGNVSRRPQMFVRPPGDNTPYEFTHISKDIIEALRFDLILKTVRQWLQRGDASDASNTNVDPDNKINTKLNNRPDLYGFVPERHCMIQLLQDDPAYLQKFMCPPYNFSFQTAEKTSAYDTPGYIIPLLMYAEYMKDMKMYAQQLRFLRERETITFRISTCNGAPFRSLIQSAGPSLQLSINLHLVIVPSSKLNA